jgi:hypothetical protein
MTTHDGVGRPSGERVEVLKSHEAGGKYYWRYFGANGEEISKSSETYESFQHAIDQGHERNPGVRVFHPGYDSDFTEDAPDWVELDFDE